MDMDYLDTLSKLIDMGFFTEDELQLLCSINGHSMQTLDDAAYARYAVGTASLLIEGR